MTEKRKTGKEVARVKARAIHIETETLQGLLRSQGVLANATVNGEVALNVSSRADSIIRGSQRVFDQRLKLLSLAVKMKSRYADSIIERLAMDGYELPRPKQIEESAA